jgi:hypothetical protein
MAVSAEGVFQHHDSTDTALRHAGSLASQERLQAMNIRLVYFICSYYDLAKHRDR